MTDCRMITTMPRFQTLADSAVRSQVLDRLRRVGPQTPRRWGTMSSHEMLCHLSDIFRAVLREREMSFVRRVPVPRSFLCWWALWVPLPWPHGFPTRSEADPRRRGTRPGDFERDRAALEELVDRVIVLGAAPSPQSWGRHPLFGELSDREWMRWSYLHLDHHLRQFGV
jgi:hypothetical protein